MSLDAAGPPADPELQVMASSQFPTDQKIDEFIDVVTAQQADFIAMSAQMQNMAQQLGALKDHQSKTDEAMQEGLQDTLGALNLILVSRRWRPQSRKHPGQQPQAPE